MKIGKRDAKIAREAIKEQKMIHGSLIKKYTAKIAKKQGLTQLPPAAEHQEQKALMEWVEIAKNQYPQLKALFAIPNGEKRDISVAKRLKAEGVSAGVPDLFLAHPTFFFNGLFVEMKRKGGKISQEQQGWIERLNCNGYQVSVCYSAGEAIEVIKKYISGV